MLPKMLTDELRSAVEGLPTNRRKRVMELRLRSGYPVKAVYPWGEEALMRAGSSIMVTDRLLRELLDRATGFSPYTLREEEAGLFLPLEGGCRMGICGEVVMKQGSLSGLRHVGSIAVRFARQIRGVAEETARKITQNGSVESVLILSPPGRGKTTFLRDLIRAVSERGFRVSVADERRELAAAVNGIPQLDIGPCTDVLTGCPKAVAMERLIRVMNPQVLAVDELSGKDELRTAVEASHCGIALFSTVHGSNLSSLMRRKEHQSLLESGCFEWCVTLRDFDTVKIERLNRYAENPGSLLCYTGVPDGWNGGKTWNAAADPAALSAPDGTGTDAGGNGTAYAVRCGIV